MHYARRPAAWQCPRPDAEIAFGGEVSFEPPFTSFDHLVGEQLDRVGHLEAERSGRYQIDDEFELGGLHDRQIGGLRTLEDLTRVEAGLMKHAHSIGPIAHQPAGFDILAKGIDRGYRMTGSKRRKLDAPADKERVAGNEECVGPVSQEGGEGRLDLFAGAGFEELCLKSGGACSV